MFYVILESNDKGGFLSDRVKDLRMKKGATQEAMANELGVSAQAISKWEQNTTMPDVSMLVPIADYFGVSVDYLLREPSETIVVAPEKYVEITCNKARNAWRCTVKNISDRELKQVKFKTFFFDEDGNSIDYRENLVFNLEPHTVKPELLYSTVGANAASINIVVKSITFANEQ